jgi:small subunit ribosomal protein S1
MTTTETSTDHSTPEAPEPTAPSEHAAESETAVAAEPGVVREPSANGGAAHDGHPSEDASSEASGQGDDASGEGHEAADHEQEGASAEGSTDAPGEQSSASGGADAAPGERKKRRRRRKKKPHEAGAAPAGAAGSEAPAVPAEGEAESPAADASGTTEPRKAHERDKKKERKHTGPPRERPPVNVGDIVFGKILEITDEAILVDIPGKARAIFDRREMLIVDEDEAAHGPERASGASGAPAQSTETAQAGGAGTPLEGGADPAAPEGASIDAAPAGEVVQEEAVLAPSPEDAVLAPSPEDAVLAPSPEEAMEAPPAPEASTGLEASEPATPPVVEAESATPAESAPAESEPAPPQRDPKVPRVILEVGADFIGVVHNDGARGGLVVLTHHPNRAERAKSNVERAFNEKAMIDGLVTGVIKGGVEADVDGLRAFAPGSHVDLRLGADLSYLVGKRLSFAVTQYAKRGRDVVLSRRSLLEEEARKSRAEALARLRIGDEIEGIVRSVVGFGAFVDVGGVEGLVPLQEMSHNRADGPSDVFKAGEPTRVKVIKIDDKGKIWLSHKATIPDPWQAVAEKYAHGTKHTGKVARLQPFGAFVELEPGVDGLIHLADLSVQRIESPGDVVKVGDAIEVVVSHLDASNHKIALHPAPTGEAAGEMPQRVALHRPVKARVVTIESGGLVVRILGVTGRNSRGYITAAGTGTPRGTELRKAFKVGQDIEAKVIELDPRRGEVKLSIKALSEEQERSAYQQYRQQLKAEARFTFADLLAKKGPPQR